MRLLWLGTGLVLASCSQSGPQSTTGTIDPATGGTVAIADGSASVQISPGALAAPTVITITADPTMPPATLGTIASQTWRFGPEGLQFAKPVTITLAVDETKLPAGRTSSDVFIATSPGDVPSFTALPTTAVDALHVAAQTTHFSLLVALVPVAVDMAVALDGGPDLASGDGPAGMSDALMTMSDGPTTMSDMATGPGGCQVSPSPTPQPCQHGPLLNLPVQGCGWNTSCGATANNHVVYQVYCNGTTCACQMDTGATNLTTVSTFPQGTSCTTDGGAPWQTCCFYP
jgi:hypothetical protein